MTINKILRVINEKGWNLHPGHYSTLGECIAAAPADQLQEGGLYMLFPKIPMEKVDDKFIALVREVSPEVCTMKDIRAYLIRMAMIEMWSGKGAPGIKCGGNILDPGRIIVCKDYIAIIANLDKPIVTIPHKNFLDALDTMPPVDYFFE